jgi:membrane protein
MAIYSKIKKNIGESRPANYLIRRSKAISFPGFRGIPLYDVVLFFFGQVRTIGMSERASAIAFNFVMAIPPAIIFLFTLIPFMPISRQFEEEIYSLIRDMVPGEKDNLQIIHFLQDFINNPRHELLSLGFLLSIFFSSNAMLGIMRSFDKNYIGFRKRKQLEKRWVALKITFILFLLVFASLLLIIARTAYVKWIGITNPTAVWIIQNLRWLFIGLLFFASIAMIYKYAPAVHKKWKIFSPGSILATFLMIMTTLGFSWWVNHYGNYNELYGPISTILILMILIYSNSLVLLIGFELNVSISSLKKIADERNNNLANGGEKSA